MTHARTPAPKHRLVYEALEREIRGGGFRHGARFPSEAALVARFGVSRITVGRSVRDLRRAGLVVRRPGSGTYVSAPDAVERRSLGLLIPERGETAIFEPICRGMMESARAADHVLVQGSLNGGGSKAERAWTLCRQYIERQVGGVFFAPLEHVGDKDAANQRIVRALDAARIAVVLLDRPMAPYPEPGRHDLVGIDNHEAGYTVTEHLLRIGPRRVAFVAQPLSAATVDAREAGYRAALYARDAPFERGFVARIDPTDTPTVASLIKRVKPDGIVCANDWTAARLMRTLLAMGHRVPEDVRLVGIDDADYADVLPVPLTTFRQPAREIGEAALSAMLDRIAGAALPPRNILLHGSLVVRASCGAQGSENSGGAS